MTTVDVNVDRTRAATAARRRRAARRQALEVARKLDLLDDEVVEAVLTVLALEALQRGLEVPELFDE